MMLLLNLYVDGFDDADEARSIPRGAANEKPIDVGLARQGATVLRVDAATVKDGQCKACFGGGDRLDALVLLIGKIGIGERT